MAVDEENKAGAVTDLGHPDHDRSGPTISDSIDKAERGSQVAETHTEAVTTESEDARITEIHDAERDASRVEGSPDAPTSAPEPGLDPADVGAGGAQHVAGSRISDRVSAGQPVPDGPPFDHDIVRNRGDSDEGEGDSPDR
jgi:hypothetical protein